MGIHRDDVVSVALHKELLASGYIFADEDASSRVVDRVVLEDKVWIVERAEGEGSC
jgi:hypothetical protein